MRQVPSTSKTFMMLFPPNADKLEVKRKMSPFFFFLVGFVTAWALCTQLMIKMSSVLPLPRCPSGNASPHDHQHYHVGGRAGSSLHGNEVYHLWE